MDARKISFQEAWDSAVVFLVDEELEQEIEAAVEALLETARNHHVAEAATITVDGIADFLAQRDNALEVVLKDIELSEEKFLRIISLLRKLQHIPGGFDTEWGISAIKRKMSKGSSEAARRIRYKRLLIGTYGAKKGHKVEGRIRQELEEIKARYGVGYASGRSRLIETDIDFAVPNLEDPYVIIMSSFQETTSSGQTTKAKDMRTAYEGVCHINSRNREDRAFVNFVDGGGWLARKRDLERLVKDCHYFINFHYLDMLKAIVLKHVPRK